MWQNEKEIWEIAHFSNMYKVFYKSLITQYNQIFWSFQFSLALICGKYNTTQAVTSESPLDAITHQIPNSYQAFHT
jgi:hypothetical protein